MSTPDLCTPQFFFDDTLIDKSYKVSRVWQKAKIFPEPYLTADRPWEGRRLCLFGTAFMKQNGSVRLYYANHINSSQDLMLAESEDGIRFTKPELGEIEYDGSRANNMVFYMRNDPYKMDSPSLVYDELDPEFPYKMIYSHRSRRDGGKFMLSVTKSRNGIHWEPPEETNLFAGDRTNAVACRVGKRFEIYTRGRNMMQEYGVRAIYRAVSDDFVHWTEPEPVLVPGPDDDCDIEYYGMSVFVRHGWYLGLLEYWSGNRDEFEIRLVRSRDGVRWSRPADAPGFIVPEYWWNRKWNSCASNGPVILGEQMLFYFGGGSVSHHYDSVHRHGALGGASVAIDRFCALFSDLGGHIVTKPLLYPGGELILNADTRRSFDSHPALANGEIGIEVLDADMRSIPGYKTVFRGNTHRTGRVEGQMVRWPEGVEPGSLRGREIRLKFTLDHARLYTVAAAAEVIEFQQPPTAAE